MRLQWFNPLEQTPEGLLLKDVMALLKEVKGVDPPTDPPEEEEYTGDGPYDDEEWLERQRKDSQEKGPELKKEVKNKKKADLNDDGQLASYEKKRGKAIEASMAKKRGGYKSDRGQGPPPNLPKAKKNKTVIKFDASDNCPLCGSNPHEECRMPGPSHEMRAIDCKKNPVAFDSRFDDARQHSILEAIDEGHGSMLIARSDDKNVDCAVCNSDEIGKNVDCSVCNEEMQKADMSEKNKYCQKHFGCNYSECTPKQKAQCNRECGKELKKYSQESSVENLKPIFENVDGGKPVRAHGFTTNGTYPATNDGPQKSIVSETAKIPSVAQKGYTVKSSSLHMHYNDAGGSRSNPPNIDTIEQRLASLTKHASRNNLGIIGEIEGLLKQVKDLTESPSN